MRKIFSHIVIGSMLCVPMLLSAQVNSQTGTVTTNPPPTVVKVGIQNPFNCGTSSNDCTLMDLILAILNNIVMPIAAVFVVLWIIYAGFQFVTAQGNPTAIGKARDNLLWSLVGAGILLGAAGIAAVVKATVESLMN